MKIEVLKRLEDARFACGLIAEFLRGCSRVEFLNSLLLQSAVERQFEIIGESLGAAAKSDAGLIESLPELPRIVGLRNRLIHGYDSVDAEILWDLTQSHLPDLKQRLDGLV